MVAKKFISLLPQVAKPTGGGEGVYLWQLKILYSPVSSTDPHPPFLCHSSAASLGHHRINCF